MAAKPASEGPLRHMREGTSNCFDHLIGEYEEAPHRGGHCGILLRADRSSDQGIHVSRHSRSLGEPLDRHSLDHPARQTSAGPARGQVCFPNLFRRLLSSGAQAAFGELGEHCAGLPRFRFARRSSPRAFGGSRICLAERKESSGCHAPRACFDRAGSREHLPVKKQVPGRTRNYLFAVFQRPGKQIPRSSGAGRAVLSHLDECTRFSEARKYRPTSTPNVRLWVSAGGNGQPRGRTVADLFSISGLPGSSQAGPAVRRASISSAKA
jgi:hypothetical protein